MPRNLAQQLPTVHQLPVAILENRDLFHAEHGGRVPLLLVPRGGEISVRQGRVFRPLVPVRRDQIMDFDALPSEQRHRPPAPNLRIIRMRRNNQHPLNIPKLSNHHALLLPPAYPSFPPSKCHSRRAPNVIPAHPMSFRAHPMSFRAQRGIQSLHYPTNPHNAAPTRHTRAPPESPAKAGAHATPRPPLNSIARSYNPNTASALAAHVSPRADSSAPAPSRRPQPVHSGIPTRHHPRPTRIPREGGGPCHTAPAPQLNRPLI